MYAIGYLTIYQTIKITVDDVMIADVAMELNGRCYGAELCGRNYL